jgi:tight adherence protein B
VSAGVLCLAAALLAWPPARHTARRQHLLGRTPLGGADRRLAALVRRTPPPLLAGCVGGAVTAAITGVLVAVLAGVGVGLAVRAWRTRAREKRSHAALLGLAEAVGALAEELRSGRPLAAAADVAVASCPDVECAAALAVTLGRPSVGQAHPGPAPRLPPAVADPLDRIAGAVALSGRTGCSLAAVLTAVEGDLRARFRWAQELRAATAGPRASAMLLAGLPVLALAMGSGVGADPWGVLTGTVPGQLLLVVGFSLELAGVVWCGHLIRRALR